MSQPEAVAASFGFLAKCQGQYILYIYTGDKDPCNIVACYGTHSAGNFAHTVKIFVS
jgi:hypothetical protein